MVMMLKNGEVESEHSFNYTPSSSSPSSSTSSPFYSFSIGKYKDEVV